MEKSRLRPGVVLWWGIGLTLVGALLVVYVPNISYNLTFVPVNGMDAGVLAAVEVLTRILGQVVPTLGVVLIGSSVVMTYVRAMVSLVRDENPHQDDRDLANRDLDTGL